MLGSVDAGETNDDTLSSVNKVSFSALSATAFSAQEFFAALRHYLQQRSRRGPL